MINGNIQLKPFSTFEEYLWTEAEEKVDERLKGNYRKGAVFEAFVFLILDHVVETLGLKNKVRILHHTFSYKRYTSRISRGIDILVMLKKPSGIWTQLFAIECKDWQPRFMSPKVFLTHVWKRFENIIKPTKVLITKGVNFSVNTLTKIKNYSITQITNNYVPNIKQLITNKLTINNKSNNNNKSLSVPLHMTRFYEILTRNSEHNISFPVVKNDNRFCGV